MPLKLKQYFHVSSYQEIILEGHALILCVCFEHAFLSLCKLVRKLNALHCK